MVRPVPSYTERTQATWEEKRCQRQVNRQDSCRHPLQKSTKGSFVLSQLTTSDYLQGEKNLWSVELALPLREIVLPNAV